VVLEVDTKASLLRRSTPRLYSQLWYTGHWAFWRFLRPRIDEVALLLYISSVLACPLHLSVLQHVGHMNSPTNIDGVWFLASLLLICTFFFICKALGMGCDLNILRSSQFFCCWLPLYSQLSRRMSRSPHGRR
jgi:hypothetical protein